jgi:hypothetical protein
MRLLHLLCIVLLASSLAAIARAEYYFDSDPGPGQATPLTITPGSTVDYSTLISVETLSPGPHLLGTRFADSLGHWSFTAFRRYYQLPVSVYPRSTVISRLEYFYDTDPGEGRGIAVPVTSGPMNDTQITLDTTSLSVGPHIVGFRFANNRGQWSSIQTRYVYRLPEYLTNEPGVVSRLEYFYDSDPGEGHGTAVPMVGGGIVDIVLTLDTTSLSVGPHIVYFRFANDHNVWSSLQSRYVYRLPQYVQDEQSTITRLEYFYDSDPGEGRGTQVTIPPGTGMDTIITLDVAALPVGPHQVYFRCGNDRGRWSSLQSRYVYRLPQYVQDEQSPITRLEYFYDTDPGEGHGFDVPITDSEMIDLSLTLNTETLPVGPHQVYFRFADDRSRWSLLQSRYVYRLPEVAVSEPTTVEDIEYFFDNDPGEGHGTSVIDERRRNLDIAFMPPIDSLLVGPHTIYLRARNNLGHWSMLQRKPFFKAPVGSMSESAPVAAFDWFFTGNGANLSHHWHSADFLPGTSVDTQIAASLLDFSNGFSGVLHICPVDSLGRKGFLYHYPFVVHQEPTNIQISETDGVVQISWNAVPGADGYTVYSSAKPDQDFAVDNQGILSGNTWTITPSLVKQFYKVTSTKNATRE